MQRATPRGETIVTKWFLHPWVLLSCLFATLSDYLIIPIALSAKLLTFREQGYVKQHWIMKTIFQLVLTFISVYLFPQRSHLPVLTQLACAGVHRPQTITTHLWTTRVLIFHLWSEPRAWKHIRSWKDLKLRSTESGLLKKIMMLV